jgi:hypothetical protein
MARRCYFGTETPIVSPTLATAGWTGTGSAVRRTLEFEQRSDHVQEILAVAGATAGARTDYLVAQYTSQPLDVNQTITGTITGQVMAAMGVNASGKGVAQVFVWVMKADGTSRGTLLAFNATDASEFTTTRTNRQFPRGGALALSSVAALAGDRIVVEIGWSKFENATTSRSVALLLGNPSGTDLPQDQTDTTQTKVPWIEFSQNLTFTTAVARVSQEVAEVVRGGTPSAIVSQVVVEVIKKRTFDPKRTQTVIVG